MPRVKGGHNIGFHHPGDCCHRCRADAGHFLLLSYCSTKNRISGACGCYVAEPGVAAGSTEGCSRLNRIAPGFAEGLSAGGRGFLHRPDRVRSWTS